MNAEQAKALRAPFPPEAIGKLPKPTKKENPKGNCKVCGKYHGLPAVHLDYVGHAAITDRLLSVDPEWTWEPMAFGPNGEPLMVGGGLWIWLTVCGVRRPGFGDAEGGRGAKEMIGDALRNGAMRFGVGLDLWSKEDLHGSDNGSEPKAVGPTPEQKERLRTMLAELEASAPLAQGTWTDAMRAFCMENYGVSSSQDMSVEQMRALIEHFTTALSDAQMQEPKEDPPTEANEPPRAASEPQEAPATWQEQYAAMSAAEIKQKIPTWSQQDGAAELLGQLRSHEAATSNRPTILKAFDKILGVTVAEPAAPPLPSAPTDGGGSLEGGAPAVLSVAEGDVVAWVGGGALITKTTWPVVPDEAKLEEHGWRIGDARFAPSALEGVKAELALEAIPLDETEPPPELAPEGDPLADLAAGWHERVRTGLEFYAEHYPNAPAWEETQLLALASEKWGRTLTSVDNLTDEECEKLVSAMNERARDYVWAKCGEPPEVAS